MKWELVGLGYPRATFSLISKADKQQWEQTLLGSAENQCYSMNQNLSGFRISCKFSNWELFQVSFLRLFLGPEAPIPWDLIAPPRGRMDKSILPHVLGVIN